MNIHSKRAEALAEGFRSWHKHQVVICGFAIIAPPRQAALLELVLRKVEEKYGETSAMRFIRTRVRGFIYQPIQISSLSFGIRDSWCFYKTRMLIGIQPEKFMMRLLLGAIIDKATGCGVRWRLGWYFQNDKLCLRIYSIMCSRFRDVYTDIYNQQEAEDNGPVSVSVRP